MLAPRRRNPVKLLLATSFAGLLYYVLFYQEGQSLLYPFGDFADSSHDYQVIDPFSPNTHADSTTGRTSNYEITEFHNVEPANKTLGFGAVVAVSAPDSPRRESLMQAANVTEVDLVIPKQPRWTPDDVKNFLVKEDSAMRKGSILAWLGHSHALQWFLDSGLETALILEDDVDWDIHLRTQQLPLLARSLKSVLPPSDNPTHYYGNPKVWDLLYIGHCGDYFTDVNNGVGEGRITPNELKNVKHALYKDPSMLTGEDLHPMTNSVLRALEVPEKTRILHKSVFPLCTFAYAVTRQSAKRMLHELMPPKEPMYIGNDDAKAYDVALLHNCRSHMNCFSLSPELFHHAQGQSVIDAVENTGQGMPPVDAAGYERTMARGETANINCGFWDGQFRFRDEEELQWLREEVGRRGKCLKEGREDDKREQKQWEKKRHGFKVSSWS